MPPKSHAADGPAAGPAVGDWPRTSSRLRNTTKIVAKANKHAKKLSVVGGHCDEDLICNYLPVVIPAQQHPRQ